MLRLLENLCKFLMRGRFKPEDWRMSSTQFSTLLKANFPQAELHLWDGWYYYVKHEDWGTVLADVLLGMPKYTKERFDCSNFAMLCSSRVSERYKINTMGIVVGQSPWGYHGYNLFVSRVDEKPSLFILEPQTGDVYTPEEDSGYKPKLVIFG